MVREKDIVWKALQNSLKDNGYESIIVEADNVVNAFNKYNKLKPDVVLFDADMSAVNGIEIPKQFGISEKKAVVVLTADGKPDSVLSSLLSGLASIVQVHHSDVPRISFDLTGV